MGPFCGCNPGFRPSKARPNTYERSDALGSRVGVGCVKYQFQETRPYPICPLLHPTGIAGCCRHVIRMFLMFVAARLLCRFLHFLIFQALLHDCRIWHHLLANMCIVDMADVRLRCTLLLNACKRVQPEMNRTLCSVTRWLPISTSSTGRV